MTDRGEWRPRGIPHDVYEHWSKRKIVIVITLITGLVLSFPIYWIVMSYGGIVFVCVFPFIFLMTLVFWHEAKDQAYYWWKKRNK